jgi:PleD family two-component response regulator
LLSQKKQALHNTLNRVRKMIEILMVVNDKNSLNEFANTLEKEGADISWATSGGEALRFVAEKQYSLLVTEETLLDMSGLELARKTVMTNPMVNLAVMNTLSPKEFHGASEGLGVLCQLPFKPTEKDARALMSSLKEVI